MRYTANLTRSRHEIRTFQLTDMFLEPSTTSNRQGPHEWRPIARGILAPLLEADLSAPLSDRVYQTDASLEGFGIVSGVSPGHEVRQEAKRTVLDLLDKLADPSSELEPPALRSAWDMQLMFLSCRKSRRDVLRGRNLKILSRSTSRAGTSAMNSGE